MPNEDTSGQGDSKTPGESSGVGKRALIWVVVIGAVVGLVAVVTLYPTGGVASALSSLRFWLAILPACIILHHAVFLRLSRRSQLVTALAPQSSSSDAGREAIADKYFGWVMLAARYVPPAIIVTVLCWFALDVLASPPGSLNSVATLPGGSTPGSDGGTYGWLFGHQSAEAVPILRGARFGFAGAYLYTVILLAQRGFRRDITGGVAMWGAALFVVGPLSGALAALLITGVVGDGSSPFVKDTIFVFAGMLPREFSLYLQGSARRMLNPAAAAFGMRNIPVSVLRGATPAIEERFAEEGIEDVVALAYANPFQLIRATSYGTRQIVQWIDESLLIATVPEGWQELEKAGITGAIDLAWCRNEPGVQEKLAEATKMDAVLLEAVTRRLDEDAQVADLRRFYWTDDDRSGISFEIVEGVSPNDLHAFVASVAPDVPVEQLASVVTLTKVASKDRERVSAALAAAPLVVKPGSIKVVH